MFSIYVLALNIQSGNLGNVVSKSTANGEQIKLDSDDDQKCSVGGYADNEIQNMMLPEGTSSQSALFLEKGTPLAKVDNFVDEPENIIFSSPAPSKSSGVVFAPNRTNRNDDKEDTANNLNSKGCVSEANFKGIILLPYCLRQKYIPFLVERYIILFGKIIFTS